MIQVQKMAVKKKKPRKKKEPQVHRVYCTYFPNGDYYIGYSGKTEKLYEKYYGSSKYVLEYKGLLEKETIAKYENLYCSCSSRRDVERALRLRMWDQINI